MDKEIKFYMWVRFVMLWTFAFSALFYEIEAEGTLFDALVKLVYSWGGYTFTVTGI